MRQATSLNGTCALVDAFKENEAVLATGTWTTDRLHFLFASLALEDQLVLRPNSHWKTVAGLYHFRLLAGAQMTEAFFIQK